MKGKIGLKTLFFTLIIGGMAVAGSKLSKAGSRPAQPQKGKYTPSLNLTPGVQLYTLRDQMAKDPVKTLKKTAAMGYRHLEFAGFFGLDPDSLKNLLAALKVEPIAAHLPWEVFYQGLDSALVEVKAAGFSYAVLAWLPLEKRVTWEDYEKLAEDLNRWGKICREYDLQFVYHNHDFELKIIDDKIPYDFLLKETDSSLVKMEMDIYWIVKGGGDPLAYLEKHPGRFVMSHVKDMAEGESMEMADPGKGRLDFDNILRKAKDQGMQYFFIEHDEPEDHWKTMEAGMELFKGL